jgi:hypothetical protein
VGFHRPVSVLLVSVWEDEVSAYAARVVVQRLHIIRRRSEECASGGSEGLAGEARHRDGVEQYGSVVHEEKSKACDGSSSGTAVGAGMCIGSI